jgi:hypothetical protein
MVIGSERIRRPVAWYTALAIAADTPTIPISPGDRSRSKGPRDPTCTSARPDVA